MNDYFNTKSKHVWNGVESELQDEIIILLREFSDKGYRNFTTGFQRYYAIDIINLVLGYDHSDYDPNEDVSEEEND